MSTNSVLSLAMLLCFILRPIGAHADGIICKLPEDGAWVRAALAAYQNGRKLPVI